KKKFLSQQREPEYLYITNESHYFFGKRYLLKITPTDKKSEVILHHNKIEILISDINNKDLIKKKMYQWYRQQLKEFLSERIEYFKDKMNVSPESFGIRKVKTKWGSCNDVSKTIWFNIELVKKPKECIDYIVVHELRSEEHTSELQSRENLVCRLLLEKKKTNDAS